MSGVLQRRWRVPAFLGFAVGMLLLHAAPAGAHSVLGAASLRPTLRSNTQIVMRNPIRGSGQTVPGFVPNTGTNFDPVTCQPGGTMCVAHYPESNPPTSGTGSWRTQSVWAGTLIGVPVGGGPELQLYCIDIHTATRAGYGYNLGSWEESGMPNLGFVARLLNDYYPNNPSQPSGPGIGNNDQRAAAVQAAIWFLTDNFVVSTSGGGTNMRNAVRDIVNHVVAQGPLTTPPPPSLTINPPDRSGHVDVLGPYTVTTNHTPVTVTATGGTMYSNAAGTTQLGDGTTATLHHSGQQIWLRLSAGNTTRIVTLQATSTATVPSGNVYLWDRVPVTPGQTDAQRLILAAPATLTTTVRATGEFKPFGKLIVKKTIDGPAAHERGEVRIRVTCTDGVHRDDFVIPAHAGAGTHTREYTHIPAGTQCTVTETSNGSTNTVTVTVTGNGQEPTIPAGGEKTVHITDTYHFVPGKLIVKKIIGGPAAGQQGQIVIRTVCDGRHLTPDFVIHAGAGRGEHTNPTTYNIDPTPATCTVTQTADGHTTAVSVVTVGSGQHVHVGHGESKVAVITDDYGLRPGDLEVTKLITGPQAGHQGQIVIQAVCNGVHQLPDFVIPANTVGPVVTHTFTNIPAGATCVVTETMNGSTSTVVVHVTGSGSTAHIPPGGAGAAEITDDVENRPGELEVNKLITGPEAGSQGEIVIRAQCNGTFLTPDFVIPAGTRGPIVTHTFTGIHTPATCVVTETSDGSSSTISVDVTGSPTTVKVPPGGYGTATITDDVGLRPGELEVNKLITGPEAGHQGEVVIQTVCNGVHKLPDFVIPAGTVGPVDSHIFTGIPTPATCVVTETVDGHTSTVSVEVMGSPTRVEIGPGESGAATIRDIYGATPGSLRVTKTIAGPSAGHQGPVTIHVVCDGLALSPDFVIPAHHHAGTVSHSFDSIPAGSTCTVTETANGATATVIVQVLGNNQTVSIPAGQVESVSLTDVYDDGSPVKPIPEEPGSPSVDATGSVTVTKHITGPAAHRHGRIAIVVACGGPVFNFTFVIPAHTGPGSVTRHFNYIPSGSRCNVREVENGHTRAVAVVARGSRTVTIPARGSVTVRLTDRFVARPARPPKPIVTG